MKEKVLALIVLNENFRGEYVLTYLIGRTTENKKLKYIIDELNTSKFILVTTKDGLSFYMPTNKGVDYINSCNLDDLINNSKIYFSDIKYFDNLKSYFKK